MRTLNAKTGLVVGILAVFLFGTTAMAQVYTDPVGFVKVDVYREGLTMISVPLQAADTALNGSEGCVGDMIKENLTAGPSGAEGDEVYKWDANTQSYRSAFYAEAPGTSFDKTWFDPDAGAVSDITFAAGEALWIFRKTGGDPTETITFLGWVPMEETKSVTFIKGLNMFAYPFPVTKGLNETNLSDYATKGPSSAEADTVYTWDPAAKTYSAAFLADAPGSEFDNKWFDPDMGALSTFVFEPGVAAWFSRFPDNSISWIVNRPY
jgi:hypothetical protein